MFRSNASAQSAFQAAAQLAWAEKSQLVGAHVVAAVAEMKQGTAARALNAMRVDRAALAAAAHEETNNGPPRSGIGEHAAAATGRAAEPAKTELGKDAGAKPC